MVIVLTAMHLSCTYPVILSIEVDQDTRTGVPPTSASRSQLTRRGCRADRDLLRCPVVAKCGPIPGTCCSVWVRPVSLPFGSRNHLSRSARPRQREGRDRPPDRATRPAPDSVHGSGLTDSQAIESTA